MAAAKYTCLCQKKHMDTPVCSTIFENGEQYPDFLLAFFGQRNSSNWGSTIEGKDLSVCHQYNNILATRHVYKNIILHVLYTAKIIILYRILRHILNDMTSIIDIFKMI